MLCFFFILGPIYWPVSPKTWPDCIDHIKVKGYIRVDEADRHSPSSVLLGNDHALVTGDDHALVTGDDLVWG